MGLIISAVRPSRTILCYGKADGKIERKKKDSGYPLPDQLLDREASLGGVASS